MNYRKPKLMIALLFLAGMAVTLTAGAESLTDDGGIYFKGPMATCLSKAKLVYPCVSLSPPAYQSNTAFVTNLPLETKLPLDTDKHEDGWFARFKNKFWSGNGLLPIDLQGMDVNLATDHTGTGMTMDLGPMNFNMYFDEGNFSESQFMLGIDRTW